jgi:membrane protein YdbS with pleckstrin-like domain
MRTKLKEDETIALTIRKHWVVYVPLAAALAGLIVLYLWMRFSGEPSQKAVGSILGYLVLADIACLAFIHMDRKTNIWVVTSLRVINEWGILSHKSKESPIDKINNVNISRDPIARILGYGHVLIQTAATEGETWIKYVESPVLLQDTILKCSQNYADKIRGGSPKSIENVTRDTMECPFCAELIRKKAKACRFCNREIPDAAPADIKHTQLEETAGGSPGMKKAEALSDAATVDTGAQNGPILPGEGKSRGPFDWKRGEIYVQGK